MESSTVFCKLKVQTAKGDMESSACYDNCRRLTGSNVQQIELVMRRV